MKKKVIFIVAAIAVVIAGVFAAQAASATKRPPCPPVEYDGVLPQDGGTGPVWTDGPPTEDCDGPGAVELPSGHHHKHKPHPTTTPTTAPPTTSTTAPPSTTTTQPEQPSTTTTAPPQGPAVLIPAATAERIIVVEVQPSFTG